MNKYESQLVFNKYIVNKIVFKNNENFKEDTVHINFTIDKKTKKDNENMEITLTTKIFNEAEKNNYPFEMEIILTGYFTVINNENNIDFEPNAIAILYPYVRAIVSTYTANANVNALILPPINVNKILNQ